MPRLSLYHPVKSNDYRFFDRNISEQFTAGGTDLYIHKYLGPTDQGPSIDYTQPQYDALNPNNIQDLLFLENRDRTYGTNIYRLRGHYSVQNLDFDLSQFGLFLNNDIIFITVHYNDMIEIVGRKLMVGDVLELPHLLDYNPLRETIPTALKRFYQITDSNYASEGFSPTWYPHLWRIKCEPLVDSEEFSQILTEPINQDNYLGLWDKNRTYPPGYVITYGNKNYISTKEVPIGVTPPDPNYWELDVSRNLKDILATYNRNIEINNANLNEAARIVPLSGYDTSNLYIVPTYGTYETNTQLSGKYNQPAPPIGVLVPTPTGSVTATGTVSLMKSSRYKNPSPVIKIKKEVVKSIWDMTVDMAPEQAPIDKFMQVNLQLFEIAPEVIGSGSGAVQGEMVLTATSTGMITGPYGTADNTYATADQDPELPGFTGTVSQQMDFRADCDPRFQFIARSTPRSFGYTVGYLTGDGSTPNGIPTGITNTPPLYPLPENSVGAVQMANMLNSVNAALGVGATSGTGASPTGSGISFPQNPQVGDYFLRIDYLPQVLYRWSGKLWVRISSNVRTDTGFTEDDKSLLSGFINDSNVFLSTTGNVIPEKQALSTILDIAPDPLPPIV
jgi:hypothetical protein